MATLIAERMWPSENATKKTAHTGADGSSSEQIQAAKSLFKVSEARATAVQQENPNKLLTSRSPLPSLISDINLQGEISPGQKARLARTKPQ